MSASLVHVTDMQHSESYAINGTPLTAKGVLSDFLRCDPSEVEAKLKGKTVRLVNRGPIDNFSLELQAGDTITIYEAEVARGGVKGAQDFRS